MRDKSASISNQFAVQAAAASVEPKAGQLGRVRAGVRHPHNWRQLIRFALVGGTGYVVNLAVFALLVHFFNVHYMLAAVGAFCFAVTNNFLFNRHWTFDARDGETAHQAPRFFLVSLFALAFNLVALKVLVIGFGLPKVPAQAIAIACATPLNFVGNKLWTFHGRGRGPASG